MNHESSSPFEQPPQDNPFASPFVTTPASYGSRRRSHDAPTFPKVIAGIDLVFCAMRALLVVTALTAVIGNNAVDLGNIQQTAWFEIGAGVAILVFGIIAAIGILLSAAWAVPIGWIAAAGTLASLGVGVWQLSLMLDQMPPDSIERGPFIIGAVGMAFIRLCLLAVYVFALVKFARWVRQREESASQW